VLAYLTRLARDCDITLISFEKDQASRPETARILEEAGIDWHALSYHKRPPVLSTLWDALVGATVLRRACRQLAPDVVHVRSYVPALIAVVAAVGSRRRWKLLFDIRGFWADERVEGRLFAQGGWLYRVAKRCERRFFAEADAVVTLTNASVPHIRVLGAQAVPIVVIPTCAELERFSAATARPEGPRAVWCGSVGTFYRFDLAVRFADALALPLLVLTRQVETAREQLGGRTAEVREVGPAEVPRELAPGDVGLCFCAGSYDDVAGNFANLARAPTRFAEYLAAGVVPAVSPGIGDLDSLVRDNDVGVLIEDETDATLARAAARARTLAADSSTWERARRLAEERYSIESGVDAYLALYRELVGRRA
jgi:glycosyltransferase involved in cell wall biosynthesis